MLLYLPINADNVDESNDVVVKLVTMVIPCMITVDSNQHTVWEINFSKLRRIKVNAQSMIAINHLAGVDNRTMKIRDNVAKTVMMSCKISCTLSLNISSLSRTEESKVVLRPDKYMHRLANDSSICFTILFLEQHKLLLGDWKVLRNISLELTISMKWHVYFLRALCS